jgi:hypothetical protein
MADEVERPRPRRKPRRASRKASSPADPKAVNSLTGPAVAFAWPLHIYARFRVNGRRRLASDLQWCWRLVRGQPSTRGRR